MAARRLIKPQMLPLGRRLGVPLVISARCALPAWQAGADADSAEKFEIVGLPAPSRDRRRRGSSSSCCGCTRRSSRRAGRRALGQLRHRRSDSRRTAEESAVGSIHRRRSIEGRSPRRLPGWGCAAETMDDAPRPRRGETSSTPAARRLRERAGLQAPPNRARRRRRWINYTQTGKAPALATESRLLILRASPAAAKIELELRDISLAGRVLSSSRSTWRARTSRIEDVLPSKPGRARRRRSEANIIELPRRISASVQQLKAAIIRAPTSRGSRCPGYPDERRDLL